VRRHLTNAGYGVLDYISYPAGMLLVAPLVLRRMGAAEYGLWIIATSVISASSIIASGFCDACIQRIASLRGTGEFSRIPDTIRSMLGINIFFASLLAIGVWVAAPYAALHVAVSQLSRPEECLISLRIASFAILVRPIESVAVGVQRAFEQYRGTVQISTATRLVTLGTAAALAFFGFRTVSILVATAVILFLGTLAQYRLLRRLIQVNSLWPRFHVAETRVLLGQGFFVWLQTLGGVVFGQLDRILLGLFLGALAVTPYSLCVQFAHPIYGLTVSGLNFLFPYLSTRAGTVSREALKSTVAKAFLCNLALVSGAAALLLLFGDRLIRIWAGPSVAQGAASILPPIVVGSALMGLSVTGVYAMQALGQFRTVAFISVASKSVMLLLMVELLRHRGVGGLALSRLGYGSIALFVYLPLLHQLRTEKRKGSHVPLLAVAIGAQEGSKP
jgi:O-antigen/teichoic acid export membrane protein